MRCKYDSRCSKDQPKALYYKTESVPSWSGFGIQSEGVFSYNLNVFRLVLFLF